MKITYLGQAGLMWEWQGKRLFLDPYLSDSVARFEPHNTRKVPVDERFFDLAPDYLLFTHCHGDHFDPDTVSRFLHRFRGITLIGPESVGEKLPPLDRDHRYLPISGGETLTLEDLTLCATPARHSDPKGVGYYITLEERNYYVAGDTLYQEDFLPYLQAPPELVFLPVNGVGNNMNMEEAAAFFAKTGGKRAVPYHVGLFDTLSGEDFPVSDKIVPEIYKEIEL